MEDNQNLIPAIVPTRVRMPPSKKERLVQDVVLITDEKYLAVIM